MRPAEYNEGHFDYIILMSSSHISNDCRVVSPSSFINLVSITQPNRDSERLLTP